MRREICTLLLALDCVDTGTTEGAKNNPVVWINTLQTRGFRRSTPMVGPLITCVQSTYRTESLVRVFLWARLKTIDDNTLKEQINARTH